MNSRLLSSLAVAMLLLAACQSTPAPEPTAVPTETNVPEPTSTPVPKGQIFKIYSSLPLTGRDQGGSTGIVHAINMAIEKQTSGGVICDGTFKIVYESLDDATAEKDGWDLLTEEANAYQANNDADAMAYIGPLDSGAARVTAPILNKGSLTTISPGADYIGLTKRYGPSDPDQYFEMGKRTFLRLIPPADAQASAGAQWAKSLGSTKVFIVDDGEQYGLGPADAFIHAAQQNGLQVTGRASIDAKAGNLSAITTTLQSTKSDLVYFGGYDPRKAGQLYLAIRTAASNLKFMGTSAIMATAFVDVVGKQAQDVYATSAAVSLDQLPAKGQQFAKDYEARFGASPDIHALFGYEAAGLVLNTARSVCQKDRVVLLDAMFNTLDFDGVLGKWSFDDNGDINLILLGGNKLDQGVWQMTGSLTAP